MKKIFILLLTVVLMTSSFVSCNKTEADEGRTLDITKISTAKKAVFGTASENSGAVSIDEAMDLAEKAWELCGKYDYIKTEYGTESIPDISKYTVDYVKSLMGDEKEFRAVSKEFYRYYGVAQRVFSALLMERFPKTAQVQWDIVAIYNNPSPECAYVLGVDGLSEEDYAQLCLHCTAFLDMDVTVITRWGSNEYWIIPSEEKNEVEVVFPPQKVQEIRELFNR